MIEETLVNEVLGALQSYKNAIAKSTDPQSIEDYSRLVAITENLLSAIKSQDIAATKIGLLGFSRQVSDSFSAQPSEFKSLAHKIAEVKANII